MLSRSRFVIIGVITLVPRPAHRLSGAGGQSLVYASGCCHLRDTRLNLARTRARSEIGGIYVRNLDWRMQPWALFTGELAYSIEADASVRIHQ